jgi:hypothetical protein
MACAMLAVTMIMGAVQFLTEISLYFTIVKSQKVASRAAASTSELFQQVKSVRECVRESRELEEFICKDRIQGRLYRNAADAKQGQITLMIALMVGGLLINVWNSSSLVTSGQVSGLFTDSLD